MVQFRYNPTMNSTQTISILGGSGFVGTELCAQLIHKGASIKLLTRNVAACAHLTSMPNIAIICVQDYSLTSLTQAIQNSDVVINLIGILNEKGHDGQEFHDVHTGITQDALTACQQQGIKRYLQLSALNADVNGPSHYLRSKGLAEQHLHSQCEDVAVTIFQPSVIFGENDSFLNRFAQLLKFVPLLFPLACADAQFSPVYVGDVVKSMVDSIDDKTTHAQTYPLCGPKTYTLKELVEYTASVSGHRCKVISLTPMLSKIQAQVFEYFPGKPLSVDNYNSLKVDSVCANGSTCTTALEDIAPNYLASK